MQSAPLGRLSIMMFLQYAVWGAWMPVAGRYLTEKAENGGLGFSMGDMAQILGFAGSIGAVAAPFLAGQFADRYFRTERFLAFLLLAGGVVQYVLSQQTRYEHWLWLSILYSVLYMPTIALSNSLAFAHLTDRTGQFPVVRLWGTIGWIAASWIFPMIWLQQDLSLGWLPPFLTGPEVAGVTSKLKDALVFSAILSIGYSAFALCLPATPPKRDAVERLAFMKAFGLLARPSFAVLVLAALPISALHTIYFLACGNFLTDSLGVAKSSIGPAMTIGQFSEIVVIAGLGLYLKRFGFRAVLTVGALAYALRYAAFASDWLPDWLRIGSIALHGVCFSCFYAAAFIYVDRIAPDDVRHSAQTVFGLLLLGGGPVLGGVLLDELSGRFTPEGGALDYVHLWGTLSAIAFAAMLAVALLFRDETARDRVSAR